MTFRKSVALIFLIYESLFSLDGVFERNKRGFVRFCMEFDSVDSYVEMMTHDLFLETSDVLESDESENLRS